MVPDVFCKYLTRKFMKKRASIFIHKEDKLFKRNNRTGTSIQIYYHVYTITGSFHISVLRTFLKHLPQFSKPTFSLIRQFISHSKMH